MSENTYQQSNQKFCHMLYSSEARTLKYTDDGFCLLFYKCVNVDISH